jgi:F-type H+-transporting ATPase subunit epsilon
VTLHVELVSPEASVWQGDVEAVLLRTIGGGDIQFLTGHAPFLGALDICTVDMALSDGSREKCAVRGGFVEVSADQVKILSDEAEMPHNVQVTEARQALADCEAQLARGESEIAEEEARWHRVRLATAGEDA